MAWRKAPPELVALFDTVVPSDARVERRQMFGYPAAFAAGKLFAGLHQEDFILKLAEEDRERLRAEYDAQPFEPIPGRRMREYVALPRSILSDRPALDAWLKRSLAYAVASGGKTASRPTAVGKKSPARSLAAKPKRAKPASSGRRPKALG
jgi:TfoX/Sxy family transcriptional regulator of competence genes